MPGYSPKITYHLSESTTKQQSPHDNIFACLINIGLPTDVIISAYFICYFTVVLFLFWVELSLIELSRFIVQH